MNAPTTKELKKALLAKRARPLLSPEDAVSTGSTLLNLACSGHSRCGFRKGHYYFLVGDSQSGKTWTSLSCFAESARNAAFDDYELILDNVEDGALMDFSFYFGKKAASRIRPPAYHPDGSPKNSETVEDFYYHITDLLKAGKKIIYVLDSQDALDSKAANKKFAKQKKAHQKGEKEAGSYGDGKAKYHSENIRGLLALLRKTGSILIIIGQTRDNVGSLGFDKKTRSGGKALKFYATLEIWTSVKPLKGKIIKTVREKPRTVGIICLAEVRKNRFTGRVGKDRTVEIPIYFDYGIDDIGSCIDYLVAEQHWNATKGVIQASEFNFKGQRSKLIRYIEQKELEKDLRKLTAKVWKQIEDESRIERKRRYE